MSPLSRATPALTRRFTIGFQDAIAIGVKNGWTAFDPGWSSRIFSPDGMPAGNAKSCWDRSAFAI